MKEQEARTAFFGYWEVLSHTLPMFGTHRLTPFMRFSEKKRNLKAAELLWSDAEDATSSVIKLVHFENQSGNLDTKVIAQVMYGLARLIRKEFLTHPSVEVEHLFTAASLGVRLGLVDKNRIGENPPVALGIHHDADLEMRGNGNLLFGKEGSSIEDNPMPMLYETTFHVGFYLARSGQLEFV